jgi:acetyl-CoA C-acetyltransferase
MILTTTERAKDLVPRPVQIAASASATDTVSLHDRSDLLSLSAAKTSADRAYEMAHIGKDHINLFELHDGFTVLAALSLEACGFASTGKGHTLASSESITLKGSIPISTFGGLKARGNVGGATGVYQAVEAVLQLRGQAGENQVEGAKVAMIQNLGGLGGTAVTHILKLVED